MRQLDCKGTDSGRIFVPTAAATVEPPYTHIIVGMCHKDWVITWRSMLCARGQPLFLEWHQIKDSRWVMDVETPTGSRIDTVGQENFLETASCQIWRIYKELNIYSTGVLMLRYWMSAKQEDIINNPSAKYQNGLSHCQGHITHLLSHLGVKLNWQIKRDSSCKTYQWSVEYSSVVWIYVWSTV